MATVFLPQYSGNTTSANTMQSVVRVHAGIESILAASHELLLPPARPLDELRAWLDERIDAIDVLITPAPGLVTYLRRRGWRGRVIAEALGIFPRGAMTIRLMLPWLRRGDFIWCTCTADIGIYRELIRHDGTEPASVLLPFGVDTARFTPEGEDSRARLRLQWNLAPDEFVLAYVGRLTAEKNVHSILDVLGALNRTGKKIKLFLVGTIEETPFREFNLSGAGLGEKLQRSVDTVGLPGQVIWKSWMDDAHLNELFNVADVLINLTLHHDENFGFTQVEAMSAGLPVIGTAWGGLKDSIIDGETGFLVDTWVTDSGIRFDFPRAVNAVLTLMDSPDRRAAMRISARTHAVKDYGWGVYRAKLLDLVDSVVRRPAVDPDDPPPTLTEFGRRFHGRFNTAPQRPPAQREILAPVYDGCDDPDYQQVIRPYTSCERADVSTRRYLFQAVAGHLADDLFRPTDPLWPTPVSLDAQEESVMRRVILAQTMARETSGASDHVLGGLVKKGLLGLSDTIVMQELSGRCP